MNLRTCRVWVSFWGASEVLNLQLPPKQKEEGCESACGMQPKIRVTTDVVQQ